MGKQRLAKLISGILTALTLLSAPVCASAAEQPSGWGYWGLPEEGKGSVTFTLALDEKPDALGKSERLAIAGISFDVYQVWELAHGDGQGAVAVADPFTSLLSEEDLVSAQPSPNELHGTAPSDSVRMLAEDLMKSARQNAAPYRTAGNGADQVNPSDTNGVVSVGNLPYGGYLFVPVEDEQRGDIYIDGIASGYADFLFSPFLVTVPARKNNTDLSAIENISEENSPYLVDVVATPKLERAIEPLNDDNFMVAKVDKNGKNVKGAKLQIIRRGEDRTKASTVIDRESGELAIWITTDEVKSLMLEEGDYTVVEVAAPEGYALAEDLNFHVDHMGNVTYFNSSWVQVESKTNQAGLAVDKDGLCVNGAAEQLVTMVDPENPDKETPPPTQTPTPGKDKPNGSKSKVSPTKTGDTSQMALFGGILIAAAAVLFLLKARRKTK